jgi:hypothetical protein
MWGARWTPDELQKLRWLYSSRGLQVKRLVKHFPGRTPQAIRAVLSKNKIAMKVKGTKYQRKQMAGILRKCHEYFVRQEKLFPQVYSWQATLPSALVAPVLRTTQQVPLHRDSLPRDCANEAAGGADSFPLLPILSESFGDAFDGIAVLEQTGQQDAHVVDERS